MVITVSGLDGSGKSTLIDSVKTALEASNRSVVVCHMNHDIGIYASLRAVSGRRRASGEPRPPRASWKKLRYAIVWNKPCRRLMYLADLLIFLVYRFYVQRMRRRTLLMDRYFYDTLVDLAGPYSWGWLRVLAWLTPTPTVAVFLAVTPEEAYARKGEYSVEYLARRSGAYKRVFRWVPSAIILEDVDLIGTTSELTRLLAEGTPR